MTFHCFRDVDSFLNSLINYELQTPLGGARDRLKLEPAREAAARLGMKTSLPSCVHIAGTKGKGSTAAILEAVLAARNRVLSFTSPHLLSVKERVRLCGRELADDVWCRGFEEITETLGDESSKLTYFEAVFVFYLWAARDLETDRHIVEVGLGGKWDATNVLTDTLSVITPVDYDHTQILGNTIAQIAGDKAGIIKPRSKVVIGRQSREAETVILDAVAGSQSERYLFGDDYGWRSADDIGFDYFGPSGEVKGLKLKIIGEHQRDNAATALCAAGLLGAGLPDGELRSILASVRIPGRQELLPGSPDILLDVSHNPASFRALADTLDRFYKGRSVTVVVGILKDKDFLHCLEALKGRIKKVITVPIDHPRACDPKVLAGTARSVGLNAVEAAIAEEAFATLHGESGHDLGVVAGSFYLAGEYLSWRQHAGIA